MSDKTNDDLLLICGETGTGKSASLMSLSDDPGIMYLNCEAGKKLPFPSKFKIFTITDPYEVLKAFDHVAANPGKYHTIVIDTLTYLMNMFESMYVLTAEDGRSAWSAYKEFFKDLMQDKIAKSKVRVIVYAHNRSDYNEATLSEVTQVPVKGSLKSEGVESYFSTVLYTKKINTEDLEDFKNDLLDITEDDELDGFKYVFQTRLTADTKDYRIRSPLKMWSRKETYIDNDVSKVLGRLKDYYAD